jgi:hypothetical protein
MRLNLEQFLFVFPVFGFVSALGAHYYKDWCGGLQMREMAMSSDDDDDDVTVPYCRYWEIDLCFQPR